MMRSESGPVPINDRLQSIDPVIVALRSDISKVHHITHHFGSIAVFLKTRAAVELLVK